VRRRRRSRVTGNSISQSYEKRQAFSRWDVYSQRTRVPHIWPSLGQMWELTDAGARVPVASENFRYDYDLKFDLPWLL
jgi:hypothetical protein